MEGATYPLSVEGVGDFIVRRMTMGLSMKINLEYERYTRGESEMSDHFRRMASAMAHTKILVKESPEGWDIDELDPLSDDAWVSIVGLYNAILDKEQFFRNASPATGPSGGERSSGLGGDLVPENVPDPTE